MARQWLLRGALASVFVTLAAVVSQGGLIVAAHAWETRATLGTIQASAMPAEAQGVLKEIAAGGPYAYAKDGVVFGNYEHILPQQRRGYYHEYTVPTPSAHNRGARRIVCGGPSQQIGDCYYTGDHYASFQHIVE
jgi:ribonuclease T1